MIRWGSAGASLLAGVLVLAGAAAEAADRWHEVRTPGFVVVTNAGEGDGREVGRQFEQVRGVFARLMPWAKLEDARPMVIFVLRRESDLEALAPHFWEEGRDGTVGVYVGGAGADFVALLEGVRLRDELSTNPYFYAYWGYATRVLQSTFPGRLPPWLQRGLADVLANTIVRGKDVHVGRVVSHHLRRLAGASRIGLEELLAAGWDSEKVESESWRPLFDAHAWAFVHFLMFAEQGAHSPRFSHVTTLLLQGSSPEDAQRDVFADHEELEKSLEQYKSRSVYSYIAIEADLNEREKDFPVRELTAVESAGLRARFHVAMKREAEARALVAEIREIDPAAAQAHEVEALLADRSGDEEAARAAYERAADAGSSSYWVHYRLARLLEDGSGASPDAAARRLAALRRSVELNGAYAWSQASLARALSDSEPGDEAVAAARRAVGLDPSETSHRLALIGALWEAGEGEQARAAAEAALRQAQGDERPRVEQWVSFLDERLTTAPSGSAEAAGETATGVAESAAAAARPASGVVVPERVCGGGDPIPCVIAAERKLQDDGTDPDAEGAAALLGRACDLGDLFACARLASLRVEGRGVERDVEVALGLSTRACDGGQQAGCGLLATLLLQRGRPEDRERAHELLVASCDAGVEPACGILEQLSR